MKLHQPSQNALFLVGNLTCSVSLGCCEIFFFRMHPFVSESKEFEPINAFFFKCQFVLSYSYLQSHFRMIACGVSIYTLIDM